MAHRAVLREARGRVVGICRPLKRRQVTTLALTRRPLEHTIDVALAALHGCVAARERESSRRVVVESRTSPNRGVVACIAAHRKSSRCMVRVRRLLKSGQVTSLAPS